MPVSFSDLYRICSRPGMNRELPHMNKSDNWDYKKYCADESLGIVSNSCSVDFETYGYRCR
jgi:hypothetical protein